MPSFSLPTALISLPCRARDEGVVAGGREGDRVTTAGIDDIVAVVTDQREDIVVAIIPCW
jgi:hypothetical protein